MDSKTFAIITDIHSNFASLTKALAIIDERDDIDQIICLGDCFALGPEPEKTMDMLKSIPDCIFIRGNHDRYLIEKLWEDDLPSLEGMDPYDPICQAIVKNEKWTAELLGDEGHNFCKDMKIAHREIIDKTLIEFTHAWYKRDDKKDVFFIVDRKSRIIMKDGIRIFNQIQKVKEKRRNARFFLKTSAPVCSKTKKYLNQRNIEIFDI